MSSNVAADSRYASPLVQELLVARRATPSDSSFSSF
jgi:hypothetical protein